MKVEIKSSEIETRSGQGKTGPYTIRKQSGYLDTGKAYPVEVRIRLDDQQPAFAPGTYEIGPECFYVAQYGETKVDLSKVKPMRAPASRVA